MNDLSVGDKVVIRNRYGVTISRIVRETTKQWIVDGVDSGSVRRFRKSDLIEIGCDMWHIVSISKCTDDIENDIRKKQIVRMIKDKGDLSKLPLADLVSLWEKVK